MHMRKVMKKRFLMMLLLSCSAHAQASDVEQWTPGNCAADGYCSLIRVEHEVSQNSPASSGGVMVGTIDSDGFKPVQGTTLTAKKTCRKEVRVPKVVFEAVTQMFRSVLSRGDQNALPASLNPAEQTMLLYYNTIMQQTMNFQCSN
ncbi:MAG: hypothetical protein RI932_2042 [Pseudomonadota bacterium]|jgi:hypothetical protein